MDEPRPIEAVLWEALTERNVGLFEKNIQKCGAEKLALIQALTLGAVNLCAPPENGIFAKWKNNDYQNMMLLCLQQIVRLSTSRTGLQLPPETLKKCLHEIDSFTFETSMVSIFLFNENAERLSFLYFVRLTDCLSDEMKDIYVVLHHFRIEFLSFCKKIKDGCFTGFVKSGEMIPIHIVKYLLECQHREGGG